MNYENFALLIAISLFASLAVYIGFAVFTYCLLKACDVNNTRTFIDEIIIFCHTFFTWPVLLACCLGRYLMSQETNVKFLAQAEKKRVNGN